MANSAEYKGWTITHKVEDKAHEMRATKKGKKPLVVVSDKPFKDNARINALIDAQG